jgi:hypothetical protein
MGKTNSVETIKGLILVFIFFFLLIGIIYQLIMKGKLHFRLLKLLFPKELIHIKSASGLMWITNSFILSIDIMFWFWMPFYYTKYKGETLNEKERELHTRLKQTNWKLIIFLLAYLFYFLILFLFF